jgi:hypothetical protein
VSSIETAGDRHSARDTVAGFLAVGSIILSALAVGAGLILELDARPARTGVAAALLALIAARMSARHQKLALTALVIAMIAWVVGLTIAVITKNSLI